MSEWIGTVFALLCLLYVALVGEYHLELPLFVFPIVDKLIWGWYIVFRCVLFEYVGMIWYISRVWSSFHDVDIMIDHVWIYKESCYETRRYDDLNSQIMKSMIWFGELVFTNSDLFRIAFIRMTIVFVQQWFSWFPSQELLG